MKVGVGVYRFRIDGSADMSIFNPHFHVDIVCRWGRPPPEFSTPPHIEVPPTIFSGGHPPDIGQVRSNFPSFSGV